MTAVPTDARFTTAQLAALERIEAAPDAEESLRERVAVAIYEADHVGSDPWVSREVNDWERDHARSLADAALSVVRDLP